MTDVDHDKIEPQNVTIYVDAVEGKIEELPRPDGYRPISDPLWTWAALVGGIVGPPTNESMRLFLAAARRLDAGHRQIERVRQALDGLPSDGVPRQAVHDVTGDAELAIIALDTALDIAVSLSGRYKIERPFPRLVAEIHPLVARLRDHYAHIDERAVGRIKSKVDPSAEDAFHIDALAERRVFTDGSETLGVDDEATRLCIETRDYIVGAWGDVVGNPPTEDRRDGA
jgi:hypothetical protein